MRNILKSLAVLCGVVALAYLAPGCTSTSKSATPTPTKTTAPVPTPVPTNTFSYTSTHSATTTFSYTNTFTYTNTSTGTPSFSSTFTYTYTNTFTSTFTPTGTPNLSDPSANNKIVAPTGNVNPGQVINYYLNYGNTGGSQATSIVISDNLDSNLDPLTVVFVSGPAGVVAGQNITWNIATLNAGVTGTIHFTVQVRGTAANGVVICNNFTIQSAQTAPYNSNNVCNTVAVVSFTDTPTPPPGSTNTFTPGGPTNTNTPVPPTNTPVPPTSTNTPVPPTNTNTPVGPTNTPTSAAALLVGGGISGAQTTFYSDLVSYPILWNGQLANYSVCSPLGTPAAGATPPGMPATRIDGGFQKDGGTLFYLFPIDASFIYFADMAATSAMPCPGAWSENSIPLLAGTPVYSQLVGQANDGGYLWMASFQTSPTPDAIYAGQLSGSGTVNSWTQATTLPVFASQASMAVGSFSGTKYLYFVGGLLTGAVSSTSVYRAQITGAGTIGSWSSQALPGARRRFTNQAKVVNYAGTDYLYVAGGWDGAANQSSVYYAAIGSGGVLGSWTSGSALPTNLSAQYASLTSYGSYLYYLGGGDAVAQTAYSTVYEATVGSGGSLSSWTTQPNLPVGKLFLGAITIP